MTTKCHGEDAELDAKIQRMVNQGVLLDQTLLVEAILCQEFDDFEDIENAYEPIPKTTAELEQFVDDRGGCFPDEYRNGVKTYKERLEDEAKYCAQIQEILEWWAVDHWTCEKLKEQGEPIIDNSLGMWWGRCCAGKSITLDPTFYDIYASINNNKEEDND